MEPRSIEDRVVRRLNIDHGKPLWWHCTDWRGQKVRSYWGIEFRSRQTHTNWIEFEGWSWLGPPPGYPPFCPEHLCTGCWCWNHLEVVNRWWLTKMRNWNSQTKTNKQSRSETEFPVKSFRISPQDSFMIRVEVLSSFLDVILMWTQWTIYHNQQCQYDKQYETKVIAIIKLS